MKRLLIHLICLVGLACLSACGPAPEIAAIRNRAVLNGSGEIVGVLPDGREVRRYVVYASNTEYVHTVYVVNGSITVNRAVTVRHGKTSSTEIHTEVTIDGIVYIPKP